MLRVLHWNIRKERACLAQALYSDFDILAIQEPAAPGRPPACPRNCNFWLIYGGGRAALYIHKRHQLTSWHGTADKDLCSITIQETVIYSIYSPNPRERPWTSPLLQLRAEPPPQGRVIICGDFNLHHPSWDRHGRNQAQAATLLSLAAAWGLYLITPWGEPTYSMPGRLSSTIDHAWASAVAGAPTAIYDGPADFTGSDHTPQAIRVQTASAAAAAGRRQGVSKPPTFAWDRFDDRYAERLAEGLSPPGRLTTPADIDRELSCLITRLTEIATLAAGQRAARPPLNGRTHPAWDLDVERAHT